MLGGPYIEEAEHLSIASGVLTGVAIHLALFIHGEWHTYAPRIVYSYGLLLGVSALFHTCHGSWIPMSSFLGHLLGLATSILVYRAFFHRLNRARFPGPFWARLSKLPHVWKIRDSKNHLYLHDLHLQYGDVVRTGPAEVTLFLPEAPATVGGHQSECIKGEFYDLLWPERALFAARDKTLHTNRRKDWRLGFSPEAMKYHEAKVLRHIDRLDRQLQIEAASGSVVNATEFLLWFTFDAMTDFTFSKSFNLLQEERCRHVVNKAKQARSTLGPLTPAPWMLQLGLKLLPRIWWIKDWNDSINWSLEQVQERLSRKPDGMDLCSYLMEKKDPEEAARWLRGDSLLAILAGSEPTAQSLTAIFHELAMHPEHIRKLRQDLKDVAILDNKALVEVPHLEAVIQEAMRLHPNLISGGVRKTTEKGVTVRDIFIPPHITVATPMYTISRREDCFKRGQDFIPERWTTRREMVFNGQAHLPFSIGRYNCVGQDLGMRIMRHTIAMVVQKYDFWYAPGEDGTKMESDKTDRFTAFPGRVPLCFTTVDKE